MKAKGGEMKQRDSNKKKKSSTTEKGSSQDGKKQPNAEPIQDTQQRRGDGSEDREQIGAKAHDSPFCLVPGPETELLSRIADPI